MLYLILIALALQIASFVIQRYAARLRNGGRRGGQSEEEFQRQIKRWTSVSSVLLLLSMLCLLMSLLDAKGII